jgi:ferritin-like metal-binding protein YciE
MAPMKKAAKTDQKSLQDLFLDGLKDLYYAEKRS